MSQTASQTFRAILLDLNRQLALTKNPKRHAALEGKRAGLLIDRMMQLQRGKITRRLAEALCERSAA